MKLSYWITTNKERKMKRFSFIITLVVLLIGAYTLMAADIMEKAKENAPEKLSEVSEAVQPRLQGRELVELGELKTVSGVLKTDEEEWFLETEEGLYEIHFGDHNYREKIGLKPEAGKKAEVIGFVYQQEGIKEIDIAACNMNFEGKEFRFRERDGTPLWQGEGALQEHHRRIESERMRQRKRD